MFDALGMLVITFFVMSVISIVGVFFLYFAKNEKIKKGIFYFLAIWGMVIAYCNVRSIPPMWTGEILLACGLGGLSVIALLIQLGIKSEKKELIAKILVTVSVVIGMMDCFLF